MCRHQTSMSACIPHIDWPQLKIWLQALLYIHFILLAYVPEQISPWHHTNMPTSLRMQTTCKPHISLCTSQKTATVIYHAINMHVPTTNMLLKCHIYATYVSYFINKYEPTMSVYMPHMNSMQATMWPEALIYIQSTLLAYVSEQIHLPIAQIFPTAHLLQSTYRLLRLHISIKNKYPVTFIYHILQNMC